jgi:hypothetical protein
MPNSCDELDDRIQRLLDEGDKLHKDDRPEEAIALYVTAWELLPEPRTDQPYAVHVLAAMGDARFDRRDFAASRDAFMTAMRCAHGEPVGNPYLRLRLGLKQALEKKGGDCETDNNAIAHYRRSGSTVPGFHFTTLVLHRLSASLLFDGQYGSGHPDPDFG